MLTPGFPVFWAKVLEIAGSAGRDSLAWHPMGETVRLTESKPRAALERLHPGNATVPLRETSGTVSFSADTPGIYKLSAGSYEQFIACTAYAPSESSTQGASREINIERLQADAITRSEQRTPLIAIFAGIALAAAIAHWYTKK
jgi:hypothetical protein